VTTIVFNPTAFRTQFAAFSSQTAFPDDTLQVYWDMATAYVSDQSGGCYIYGLKLNQQTLALNLMAAHLAALNAMIAAGDTPGVLTGATIDRISVSLEPPPSDNNWKYWLNQTPYGQQLLALLQAASAGGFYFGGFPVAPAFRR
jgi:hypothetical protein